ncbi:MAG: Tol-Pal system beta propeller repeat protein TolB [SAR86 cluster bacterium]|uniref:Tol-Pal system protein TolB n=1 Tax=SAR86 cluster bacterium TaxID=2030880 RepID=A0A2A5CFD9_9GAMM|nr:MAG: Tol-Pal system beta propeller repeat protein TolB [SAR86 cluster bacterium]
MIKVYRTLLLCCLLIPAAVNAQLNIVITQGVDNPVPVAVVPFEWEGFGVLSENIDMVISNNLRNTGEFAPIDPVNMLSQPHEQDEVYFRDWRFLDSDYLLVGKISRNENSQLMQVQYEFFDVLREERLFGEVITGNESQLRDIAHKISDLVFEEITGVRGAFSTKILYVKEDQAEAFPYRLEMADADGGRPRILWEGEEPIMSPAWSPDGSQIAYVSFETGRSQIFIQNISSGVREQLTNFTGINSSPAFSPDGNRLAMVSSKDGNPDIYILDLRTRDIQRITNHFAIDTEPSWTPDGSALIFTSERSSTPQIYQVDLETRWEERLTFEGNYNARARMLSDGNNMIIVHRYDSNDDFHISVLNLERGTIRILTETALDESPSIAPNASMVIYASKSGDRGILNAVSIDGRVKFQIPSAQGNVREPAWSPFLD